MHMERLSYIAKLPDELLLVIFERLPFWDRVRAATVCQRWRTVSLEAVSALWSDIPSLCNLDIYEPLLARARNSPVALTYEAEYFEDLESFCYLLSRNLSRVKSLELILPEPEDDLQLIHAAEHLDSILRRDAPILEYLVISDIGPAQRTQLPQSLQHLHLRAYTSVVDALFNVKNLSRLQTVDITFLHRNGKLRQVAGLLSSPVDTTVSAAVHFSVAYFSLRAGSRRVFRRVQLDDNWHTLLPNVTRLWLDAYPGDTAALGTSAVFSTLEELTLDATPPGGDSRPTAWLALSYPRLHIAPVVSETPRPSLDARNVADYLRHAVGLGARLERLVFDGAHSI